MIKEAVFEDLPDILELQKKAFKPVAEGHGDVQIPPMTQTQQSIEEEFESTLFLKYIENGKVIGSVRGSVKENTFWVNRLIVDPEQQRKGIGRKLVLELENRAKDKFQFDEFELFTGKSDTGTVSFYSSLGYKTYKEQKLDCGSVMLVYMKKSVQSI